MNQKINTEEKKKKLNENEVVYCPYCGKITVVNDYGLGHKIRQCNTDGCRLNNNYFSHRPNY